MYNWSGRSNKEKEVLFIQKLLGRDTSTSSLAQYGEFIPVVGNDSEPDSKLLYYKDIIESLEISATLVDRPDISDTEVVNFTLDDSGYKIVSLDEEYGVSSDNTTYSGVASWSNTAVDLTLNNTNRYLWNKTTVTLSNGSSDSSYKMIASYIGNSSNGITVTNLVEWYAISPYNTYAPENIVGSGIEQWSTDKPIGIVIDNRYIWNYNIITFDNSSIQGGYHNAMIIGDYGNQLREVKFSDATESDYKINGGKIIADESWWNNRGALGKVCDWDHVSDVTQIQINDVVIIRGIAELGGSDSLNKYQCTTLVNAKVTQITSTPTNQFRIRATTLNYIIEDAIALADDLYIQASQTIYYVNDEGLILNPSSGYIDVMIRTSSRVTDVNVLGWSIYNGLGEYLPPTTFINSYLYNGALYEDEEHSIPVDPVEGTSKCELGYYYIVDVSDPQEDPPQIKYDYYIYTRNDNDVITLQKLDSCPTSINIFLKDYSILNPIEVICDKVIYKDDTGSTIEREGLSVVILRQISSTKLELRCDNLLYEINPRKDIDDYQNRTLELINIGVPSSGSHMISFSDESAVMSDYSDLIDNTTLSGLLNIKIRYYNHTITGMMSDSMSITVVSPDLNAIADNNSYQRASDDSIDDDTTVISGETYDKIIFRRKLVQGSFDGFKDRDGNPLIVGNKILIYSRSSDLQGEYFSGSIVDIRTVTDSGFTYFNSSSLDSYYDTNGYPYYPDTDDPYKDEQGNYPHSGDKYYQVTFINALGKSYSTYYYAECLFSGVNIDPEPRYLGASSDISSLLINEGPVIGDSYFNTSSHSVLYYNSNHNWVDYTQAVITDPTKLLRDSLYDALSNGSSMLGLDPNVKFFQGLAAEDAFINRLMTNYLKVGRILYSGTKSKLPEIVIASYSIDPNTGHITDVYYSDGTKPEYSPVKLYKYTDQSSVDIYFRYSESIKDRNTNDTYVGFLVDNNIYDLTQYDFNEDGNLWDGISITNGFYGNSSGGFYVSNKFILPGTIDSPSLKTINSSVPSGIVYTSSDEGCIAYYDYYEIYEGYLKNIATRNPGVISSSPPSDSYVSNYSIDGISIKRITYLSSWTNRYNFYSGSYSAGSSIFTNGTTGTKYYAQFDGYLYWNFKTPTVELFWSYYDAYISIYVQNNRIVNAYSANSSTRVYKGQSIQINVSGHGRSTSWPSVGYGGTVNIYFVADNPGNGLNFYTGSSCINVPFSGGITYYTDRTKHTFNFNDALIVTPDIAKRNLTINNWRGVSAYVKGVIPTYTDPVTGVVSTITQLNTLGTTSISIQGRGEDQRTWSESSINSISGTSTTLNIIWLNNTTTFVKDNYYLGFNFSISTLSEVPSVITKKLLPMDPYVPASGSTPESGVDIGDNSSYSTMFYRVFAARVYNAVWNDYVDMLTVNSDLILTPGKCYVKIGDNFDISTRYCQSGTIGIHSDTFAHSVGNVKDVPQLAISVSGYVLAYTDKRYAPGTPLTSGKCGTLTKMHWWSRMLHPERLVGTYLRDENEEYWNNSVLVNGRNWIKVK